MRKNILYTLVNNGINSIFPIVIIPIATQKLTPDEFGYVAFILTVYTAALAVSQVGFDTYGLRELGREKENQKISNLIYTELVLGHIAIITAVVAFVIALKMVGMLEVETWILSLIFLTLYASALQTDWALFSYGDFGSIAFRNLIVKSLTVFAILFILKNGDGGTKYVAIVLSSYIASSFWTFALANKFLSITGTTASRLAQRLYAIRPFIISRVMSAILQNADILVVGWLCSPKETAYYFIARKVAQAGSQFFSHIAIVFNNALYKSRSINGIDAVSPLKGLDLSVFFAILSATFISFNGTVIVETLSGNDYLIEADLLKVLSILIVANAFTNHIGINVLYYFGKDYSVAKSTFLSAIILAATIVPLTSSFGIYGAAAAIVFANLAMSIVHCVFSSRLLPEFPAELFSLLARPILIGISLIAIFTITSRLGVSYTSLNKQMMLANLVIAVAGVLAFQAKRIR